jgi:hypothetical protein
MLATMGIDVWRRRADDSGGRRSGVATPEPLGDDAEAALAAVPASAAPGSAGSEGVTPAAQIDLVALAGSGGVVVGRFGSPEERRLAHGVYLAVAGAPDEPVTARFQWPPPAALPTGPTSGATACRAFLEGQVDRARAACLVLLGDPEADGLPDPERVSVPVVRGPSASALRSDPALKRQLWHAIATTKRR